MKYSFEELGLVDAPPESVFDNLTKLATSLFNIPVSLVSIVDFDNDRQFFKSQSGLLEPWATQRQTPLSHSFCQYVVNGNANLVVEDATQHPVLKDNLAIPDLGVAAYLGAPILNPEYETIGAFCVIDSMPRQWTDVEIEQIERLSKCVNDAIRLKAAHLDSEALRKEQADFTYAISHDLMSPANTLHLILNEVAVDGDKLSSDVQMLVTEGLGTVKRMRQQVEDVLQYSQTVGITEAREAVSLELLVGEILRDLKCDIAASGASISLGKLPVILGYPMQLRALFQNLICNALKFRDKNQPPIVAITTTFSESSGQHRIMVKDNGIGIAPEHQALIFKLFSRLHLRDQYAGTGIGLALCHRVMSNHDGSISITSDGKNGSTFSANFPDHPL